MTRKVSDRELHDQLKLLMVEQPELCIKIFGKQEAKA